MFPASFITKVIWDLYCDFADGLRCTRTPTWRSYRSAGRWRRPPVGLALPGSTRLARLHLLDSKQANFTNNIHLLQESESTMPDMDGLNMGGPTFSVGGGGKKKKGKGKKHWALLWFVFLTQSCRPFSNKFLLDLMIWREVPPLIRI